MRTVDRGIMTYAGDRQILDADSHVMELPDFLESAMAGAAARRADTTAAARAEERLLHDKGWLALGAFDSDERSRALDLLGFDGQLVFATFATTMFAGRDLDRLYAGSAAQNRAMAEFCSR